MPASISFRLCRRFSMLQQMTIRTTSKIASIAPNTAVKMASLITRVPKVIIAINKLVSFASIGGTPQRIATNSLLVKVIKAISYLP